MAKKPKQELRPDIQAAADRIKVGKVFVGRTLSKLHEHLAEGEQVEQMIAGNATPGGGRRSRTRPASHGQARGHGVFGWCSGAGDALDGCQV